MDRFLCSGFQINMPDMIGSFIARTTDPIVAKNLVKFCLRIHNFNCNFVSSRGKILLWLFFDFFIGVHQFYTSNFKSLQAILKVLKFML